MNTEFEILINIYTDININIEHIQSSKKRILQIIHDIHSLNNNYFDTIIDDKLFKDYIKMFDDVDTYQELINNLDNLKLLIKELIKNKCEHEWVDDLIDIGHDKSQHICYCVKCEVTKK